MLLLSLLSELQAQQKCRQVRRILPAAIAFTYLKCLCSISYYQVQPLNEKRYTISISNIITVFNRVTNCLGPEESIDSDYEVIVLSCELHWRKMRKGAATIVQALVPLL